MLSTLAVAGPVSVSAPAEAASPGRAGPGVAVTGTNSPFSPNGDGSKDRGAVVYRLAKRAYVTVTIKGTGGAVVLTTNVGRAKKGNHTYVWDGKRAGRVVGDGTYTITVLSRATKHGRARAASTRLVVDARYGSMFSDTLALSSDTVYPRTTVIHDEVLGTIYLPTGHEPATVRRQVFSPSGRLVDSARLDSCDTVCTQQRGFSWDGRDSNGAVVAAGTYRIGLAQGRDAAGNPRLLQPQRAVKVSTQRLVAKTTTVSATAQTFTRRDTCYHGPNDCYLGTGGASARFPGGVSYKASPTTVSGLTYNATRDSYVLPVAGRSTPFDNFTVTAHGGPSTAGDDDAGTLSTYVPGAASQQSVTLQGDTTGTLTRVPYFGMRDTYDGGPGGDGGFDGPVLSWGFGTVNGNAYDMASFDVSYTRYVLP